MTKKSLTMEDIRKVYNAVWYETKDPAGQAGVSALYNALEATEPAAVRNRYVFTLDGGEQCTVVAAVDTKEMAEELQAQEAGGYVYDENHVIPVRRIVCVSRCR